MSKCLPSWILNRNRLQEKTSYWVWSKVGWSLRLSVRCIIYKADIYNHIPGIVQSNWRSPNPAVTGYKDHYDYESLWYILHASNDNTWSNKNNLWESKTNPLQEPPSAFQNVKNGVFATPPRKLKNIYSTGNPLFSNITCIYKQMVDFSIAMSYILPEYTVCNTQNPPPTFQLPLPSLLSSTCLVIVWAFATSNQGDGARKIVGKHNGRPPEKPTQERWWDVSGDQLKGGVDPKHGQGIYLLEISLRNYRTWLLVRWYLGLVGVKQ